MDNFKEIHRIFYVFLDTVDKAQIDGLYNESKDVLTEFKKIVSKWHGIFEETESLASIDLKEIEYMDQEVFKFVDKYQPLDFGEQDYTELLEHYLLEIKRYWAEEIKKGKNYNER